MTGAAAGIVFTYQACHRPRITTAQYGYLNQLVYNSSGSIGDVTNLSLFGMSNLSLAANAAANAIPT